MMERIDIQKEVAKGLLQIKAVFLRPNEPFTWASGIKSPIYCDNRLILTAPSVRDMVENHLQTIVREEFADVECLMGTATAGIPHAAIVADKMNLPMGYVRSSNKDHGRSNRIEGEIRSGQKVVVVEDLISTAGSSLEVVSCLREAGCNVLGMVSIFTYGMQKGLDRIAKENVKTISLCSLDILLDTAVEERYITIEDKVKILKFRDNPSDERWMK